MKIYKLQSGGLPLVRYTPPAYASPTFQDVTYTANSQTAGSSSSSSSKSSGLADKELTKSILEHSLPSDAKILLDTISNFENQITSGLATSSGYTGILKLLNEARVNKEQYDSMLSTARSNGTMNEVAITPDGGVFYRDSSGKVSIKSISKVKPNDFLLTNAMVAQLRAYDTSFAFDKGTLNTTIGNAVSTKQVIDYVNSFFQNLGHKKTSNYFYVDDNNGAKIIKGYQAIKDSDKSYKVTISQQDNKDAIDLTLNSIINNLPPQILNHLSVKAKLHNVTINEILFDMVQSKSVYEIEEKYSTENKGGSGSSKSGSKKQLDDIDVTGLYAYQTGKGGQNQKVELIPGGKYSLITEGKFYGQPVDADGKPIEATSLRNFIDRGFGTIGNVSNGVYFGNQRIDPTDYDQIMYDGTQLSRVLLPYTKDENGTIHPNFKLLKNFEQAQEKLKTATTLQSRISILREYGFEDYLKENGEWNTDKVMPFLITRAYGSGDDSLFGGKSGVVDIGKVFVDKEQYLVKVPNSKRLQATMINTLSTKNHPVNVEENIYQGSIFIPVLNATDLSMIVTKKYPIVSQQDQIGINDIRNIDQNKTSSKFVSANSSKL